jgi:hypothetical protein
MRQKNVVRILTIMVLGVVLAEHSLLLQGQTTSGESAKGKVAYSVSAQGEDVLENGSVRLAFDRRTGQFEAQALEGGMMRLHEAGPALERDKQKILARQAVKVDTRHERFKDAIGQGEKLVIEYRFGDSAGFRYELSVYEGEPWISATAYLPAGDYGLGDFSLIKGKIRTLAAFKMRVYFNSGQAGGDTGVGPMGMSRRNSAALSVFYEPHEQEAIGVGFYSFYRASTSVTSQYLSPNEIGLSANAHYNSYRPADEELRTESVLLNFRRDPLKILDEWAQAAVAVVKPQFIHDAHTGYINTWYMYGDQTTQEETVQQARMLRDSILSGYGIKTVSTGEWQLQHTGPGDEGDALGFGENEEDRSLYSHGIKWLIDQIKALGLEASFGANYCYAALQSAPVKKNVPWIIKEDNSRLGFGYPIDFTHPEAQQWLRDIAQRTAGYKASEWWSDFNGGPTRGKLHDPKQIMGFEDIREGLRVIRDAIGPNVTMEPFCCGPYFTYVGLIDRNRTGHDMAALGDFDGLKAIARQLAGTYMLHQRFWVNDPDPLFVGGRDFVHNYGGGAIAADASILDEVRMRLQLQLTSGGFVGIGENMEDFDAERTHLLTLVLPTYGQAARPLDLFIHSTPEIYDLPVKADWDEWHVLVLQNWNDESKKYSICFSQLGLNEKQSYLVFRFWDQSFVGEFRRDVALEVGARTGETFAIRDVPKHPWVVSTDMHLTQGGMDLQNVTYNQSSGQLTGMASRHVGAQGHVVVYVPKGYKIQSGSGTYSVEEQSSGAMIVRLPLEFKEPTTRWVLNFELSPPGEG